MKKLFKAILFWWNYVVLKKERTEIVNCYGFAKNKKDNIYYYRDVYEKHYIGTKEIGNVRLSRSFIKRQDYVDNTNNK